MARGVIVIDMVRGFFEEGYALYCGAEARKIIPNVQRLLKDMQAEDAAIFYLVDMHDPDDKEFQMFPPHCVKGTVECEIIPELSDYPGIIIPKRRFSSFFGTDLKDRLAKIQPEEVIVAGVCTDICVMYTVEDLRNRDYSVVVYADCVASFDQEAHALNGIDYFASWNFKHLVKVNTRREVNLVNALEGYKQIEIIAPPEL